jgi:IS605 OrfB family transposase
MACHDSKGAGALRARRLRQITAPYVAAGLAGARVRTRFRPDQRDAEVLTAVGGYLGSMAGADLAQRCAHGRLDARQQAESRRVRKQALTARSSSRWAGAITRSSEDAWQLAARNLAAARNGLEARISAISKRPAVPAGQKKGRTPGYATQAERFGKQRRLQMLQRRLAEAECRAEVGRVSVCRGSRRLARGRHQLEASGLTLSEWRERWQAARMFLCADGEADAAWGNQTIRWHPEQQWLEIKLPPPLAHLANRPHGRYRLSCPVAFSYRGAEVAAQAATGAVRYDISFDPARGRWYLDASWKLSPTPPPGLGELRRHRVLAADLNAGHLAAQVLDPSGNPAGKPHTIELDPAGLPATTRDARIREAVSRLLRIARDSGCAAIAIENLDFKDARQHGRDHAGRRPSRGTAGRRYRRLVAGIPTGRFRDRLAQMAANTGIAVVAVDPAYTSIWGAQHWLAALKHASPNATGHHAAALVIGRRALGQRARRRERCDWTRPEDRRQRATNSAVRPTPAPAGLAQPRKRKPGIQKAHGQPRPRRKTPTANRAPPGNQVAEDRLPLPNEQGSLLLRVLGTVADS